MLVTVGFATPQVRNKLLDESQGRLNTITSGRAGLISNGLRIARDHPVARRRHGQLQARVRRPDRACPGATQEGRIAFDAGDGRGRDGDYGAGATRLLLGAAALSPRSGPRSRGITGRVAVVAGLTLGAIAVHSLFYNALFEDPDDLGVARPRRARRGVAGAEEAA